MKGKVKLYFYDVCVFLEKLNKFFFFFENIYIFVKINIIFLMYNVDSL